MSRILEALKQIEGNPPEVRPAAEPRSTPEPAEPGEAVNGPPAAEEPTRAPAEELGPYRELAENVLCELPSGHSAVLLFTSPGDGEGKTAVVASLAAVLAGRVPGEVLAVDANFRRPELAMHLAGKVDRGVVDVLTGTTRWQEVVLRSGVKHLSLLPGGRFPTHDGRPPDRLELAGVLDELRCHYRLVLLDAASLAHGEVAPMARWCEGTYLAVRLGQTPRRAVRRAIRVVQQCGGRVLGCVVTGVPSAE